MCRLALAEKVEPFHVQGAFDHALDLGLGLIALFGPPLGRTWDPSAFDKGRVPSVRPLVANDWTVLTAEAPTMPEPTTISRNSPHPCPLGSVRRSPSRPAVVRPLNPSPARLAQFSSLTASGSAGR